MDYFQEVSSQWAPEKVVFLSVHVKGTTEAIRQTVDELGLTFTIPLDLDGAVCNVYAHGYPTTFFIDRNGIVRLIQDEVFHGPDAINNIITSLVSESET